MTISELIHNCNLRQLINFPTRGRNTLDLVLTKLHEFYDKPSRHAPFGLSDHMCVVLKPKERSLLPKVKKTVTKKRNLRPSFRFAFRKYLEFLDISTLFDQESSCAEKTTLLGTIISTDLNNIPLSTSTVCGTGRPSLIKIRQKH